MDETKPSQGLTRFGPFEFDSASLELRRRGVTVRIQGQPLQVLALLLEQPGSLVTRDTLRLAWHAYMAREFDTARSHATDALAMIANQYGAT